MTDQRCFDSASYLARPIRVEYEGACYHVMARGNEGRPVFKSSDDKNLLLKTVEEMEEQFGILIHVYCLMPNHYHLVVTTPRANLSQAVGWLQTTYTIRFNCKHKRSGHLFQGRFKAIMVEADEYAQHLVRYVHLNPVRPQKKEDPIPQERKRKLDQFQWSSHLAYAGKRKPPVGLNTDWLSYWGQTRRDAELQYRRDISRCFGRPADHPLQEVQSGVVLGSEALLKRVQGLICQKLGHEEMKWARQKNREEVKEYILGLTKEEEDVHLQIWMRAQLGGERRADVARDLGYSQSAVTHIVKRIEQRAQEDTTLHKKLKKWKAGVSTFKS